MAKHAKALAGLDHGSMDAPAVMAGIIQGRPAVRVEYPGEGEAIVRPSYTFKISAAAAAESVDVSIDQGEWLPCREALGFWWYDWSGSDKGEHELTARSRVGANLMAHSSPRLFSVV